MRAAIIDNLIFIDQNMNKLSDIDTARKIREVDRAALIFVTTSEHHAIESCGVWA